MEALDLEELQDRKKVVDGEEGVGVRAEVATRGPMQLPGGFLAWIDAKPPSNRASKVADDGSIMGGFAMNDPNDRVALGKLGDVFHVTGSYTQDWLYLATDWNWRLDSKHNGPSRTLADIGSHWCDLAEHVSGSKIVSVLADLTINGQVRKVLMSAQKNGFLYVLDRTNGQLLAAHPYVKVNWATHIDLETGRPVMTDVYERAVKGEQVEVWPSRGTNASLMAFNPKTGLVYLNSWEVARILKFVKFEFVLGQGSTGIETSFRAPDGEPWGYHVAFDPLTGKPKWKVPLIETASSAGMLATDGGLLFTGKITGEFIALDQDTGQTLWQFKTGSGINSPPITFTHQRRQYVTVLSGIGGCVNRRLKGYDLIPTGGSVTTLRQVDSSSIVKVMPGVPICDSIRLTSESCLVESRFTEAVMTPLSPLVAWTVVHFFAVDQSA